jgi:hypothetical protein
MRGRINGYQKVVESQSVRGAEYRGRMALKPAPVAVSDVLLDTPDKNMS